MKVILSNELAENSAENKNAAGDIEQPPELKTKARCEKTLTQIVQLISGS